MIGEIAAGVLSEVVVATGRRAGGALFGTGESRYREELEVAAWFNTYRLTASLPELALPVGVTEAACTQFLEGDACHAVLHELLAARLCDAPEADIAHLRKAFQKVGHVCGSGATVDDFLQALFDYFDLEVCTLVGRLEGGLPAALPKVREGAIAARIVAALHAIERHTVALNTESDPTADQKFLLRYRRHVIEHHGKIEPPDFERRRRVPIEDLYVSPDIESLLAGGPMSVSKMVGKRDHQTMDDWARDIDRTVLLGAPGAGKSTACHVLMYTHAGNAGLRAPFLVTLREFASHERSVVGHIEHELETFYQCGPPPGLVARLLLDGAALVVFDGLDELLDTTLRAHMTAVIERFASEYPHARILVTSRIVGYDQARLDERQFSCYRIGNFDKARVADYASKWFAQEQGLSSDEAKRWASAFVQESATVSDLRTNPLMLALMCILYRGARSIPRTRIGVYEQCANLLFRRWDAQRDIHVHLRARHLVEPMLRHLAYWLFTNESAQTAVTEQQLVAETAAFLERRGIETAEEAIESAHEFVDFCRGRAWVFSDAGTTAAGEPLYTFTHRTFLEYFAAYHLAVTHDSPEKLAHTLAPHVARQQWDVVAELAIQVKDRGSDRGAERVIAELLADRRKRAQAGRGNLLRFLARCVDAIDLPPHIVRELTRRILDHAFLADRGARDRAVPLGTLLTTCWPCREIVRAEVTTRADAMINSTDAETSLDGLRLAVLCDHGSFADRDLRQDTELEVFWKSVAEEYATAHRGEILAASATDAGFRFTALSKGFLTAEQALAQDGLPALFGTTSTDLFTEITWAPWMLPAIGAAVGVGWSGPSWHADCAALGRFLTGSWQQPPWDLGSVGWSAALLTSSTVGASLDEETYVGAAIGLLIFAEHIIKGTPGLVVGADALGPLEDLRLYIQQRLTGNDGPALPRLPLPAHIQEPVDSWARGEIDFDVRTGATRGTTRND